MKHAIRLLDVAARLAGIGLALSGHGFECGVRSAREFAEATESEARRIYRNGQATSLGEARLKAAQRVNTNWATESRRIEKKRAQEKFTQELSKSDLQ